MPRTDIIQSIERCFLVLEAFEDAPSHGVTTSSLATSTGLPRPVVRRIMLTLASLGYARADGSLWQLEPTILRFAAMYAETSPLIAAGRSHVEELSHQFNETVGLSERDGLLARIVCAHRVEHYLAIRADIGQPLPLHATASGLVILAAEGIPPNLPLPAFTDYTIRDMPELVQRLERVKQGGYALCDQELELGLIDASVPVTSTSGEFLGALTTAVSRGRRDADNVRREVVPALIQHARLIAADLALLPTLR